LLLFYFIIGIVSFSIHLQLNQLSYIEYLKSPLEVTAQNVANKYNEELNHSVFSQIAVILMYPNAFLAGVFYIFNEKFTKIKLLVYSFAVAILFFLIFGDKGPLFLVLFLFVTGLTLARKINNEKVLIKKEWIPKLLFVGLLLLVLIIIAFLSRSSGMEGNELSDFLLFSIRSYSLGHLHAFNDWLNYYSNNYSLYQYSVPNKPFGFYTFKSIYDILNIDVLVPLGTYDEYFNNGYLETNIYTVFRGLIYDFGILGSYLLSFLFGSLVCLGSEINNRCKKTISITMWFVFFTALYSSYGVSTFIWKTTIGSISIVFISFIFIEFKSIKQNKKINV
jgi:oligosaccharide repeat unit polymerase